jgi:hypothetical protein
LCDERDTCEARQLCFETKTGISSLPSALLFE